MNATRHQAHFIAAIAATLVLGLLVHSPAFAQQKSMKGSEQEKEKIALSGFCPVCVIEMKKWEKGDANISSKFDGMTYLFPSEEVKTKFEAAPEKYVPVLNGDCIVCFEKHGKRVPGTVQHAKLNDGRLYLFPSEKEMEAYESMPKAFAKSDLAVNGECIVCLAKMGKHVAGSSDHTVIHNGLRYLFPSENEAKVFRQSPQQFISKVEMMGKPKTEQAASVQMIGRSCCAGCEFGVKPIADPNELGLAIVSSDGSVTVVEEAHEKFPEIYAARFQGKQLVVTGTVLKKVGNVSWIQPSSLRYAKK